MRRTDSGVVALNLFPLRTQQFDFQVFRSLVDERAGKASPLRHGLMQRKLPRTEGGDYVDYLVSYLPRPGFEPFECTQRTNRDLTKHYLYHLLRTACTEALDPVEWSEDDHPYRPRVLFVLEETPLGRRTVWLRPYYLDSERLFGFLADFKFDQNEGVETSRATLEMSLSLKRGRQNLDYYADRYEMLVRFTERFLRRLNSLRHIELSDKLHQLRPGSLRSKEFVFGGGQRGKSQFQGVKQYGPLSEVPRGAKLYFLYREADKPLSHDLYKALRGDTFGTFDGLSKMFHVATDSSVVGGIAIGDYSAAELERACGLIRERSDGHSVPIVIVPFHKEGGPADDATYHEAKHAFLKAGLPSQFVWRERLRNPNDLKWAISNIGLGVFAKMGGQPWQVTPATESCLIVGLGQAHRRIEGEVQRYFAYTVLTDSSGLYRDLRVLGDSSDRDSYLAEFKTRLRGVFGDYGREYDRFVVHSPFKLRQELSTVETVLDEEGGERAPDGKPRFVVMKFNDRNDYFGYQPSTNSLIPYEGTFLRLSRSEYLVWFEGLSRKDSNVRKRIQRPVHVEFLHPKRDLGDEDKQRYLQDAANLSGANWRGFNAKSLPVSVYYAQLISRFYGGLGEHGLDADEIDLSAIAPWFL